MATEEAIAREAFETAATIMVVLNADGVVRRINDRGCQVLDYDRSELEGTDWFETIVPEGSDVGLAEVLDRVRSGEENDVHENTVRTSEGEIRWIKWHVAGLRDDDEAVTNLLVSGSDVTDRVETERHLRRYEQAIESSTNLLAAIDQDYTYVLTNRGYRDFYGIEGTVDDRSVADILEPEQFAEIKPYIDRALDGESLEYETERVDRDGNERTFHVRYFPLAAEDDTIQGAVAALQDVTDRREQSRQLRREVERLEEFASVISHDLRNPLNVAQGRLALLSEEFDSDHIEPIDRSLERMGAIIEDTLTLARQGKTVGEVEPVAIADVIGHCWESVATGDATLDFDERFTIRTDRDRLRHVFENLFRNAVTHGGNDATIRIGRLDDGFFVEDDGPGITRVDRESVFEPGFTTREQGTGFGLTIVRQIAEAHGWTVTVTDGKNGGARFEFDGVEIVE